ncbi:hypothetical protein D9M69_593980 [compost metagenome]
MLTAGCKLLDRQCRSLVEFSLHRLRLGQNVGGLFAALISFRKLIKQCAATAFNLFRSFGQNFRFIGGFCPAIIQSRDLLLCILRARCPAAPFHADHRQPSCTIVCFASLTFIGRPRFCQRHTIRLYF